MWREWKEKAKLRVLGRPVTPYGPQWLDRVHGGRLPTARRPGSRLPAAQLSSGVALHRTRLSAGRRAGKYRAAGCGTGADSASWIGACRSTCRCVCASSPACGFSGFEARYYSLFPSYDRDMAPASDLQQLLLVAAYQMALNGAVTPEQIPDDPTSESERRQPFFFSAAGLPAFYVHKTYAQRTSAPHSAPLQQHALELAAPGLSARFAQRLSPRLLAISSKRLLRTRSQDLEARYLLAELRIAPGRLQPASQTAIDHGNTVADAMAAMPCGLKAGGVQSRGREVLPRRAAAVAACGGDPATCARTFGRCTARRRAELRSLIRCGVRVQDPLRFLDSVGDRLLRERAFDQRNRSRCSICCWSSPLRDERQSRVGTGDDRDDTRIHRQRNRRNGPRDGWSVTVSSAPCIRRNWKMQRGCRSWHRAATLSELLGY